MTLAVQASIKKHDGTIYVIGGANVDEFRLNLVALYSSPEDEDNSAADAAAEELLTDMARTLSPMGGAVQTVQNMMPGAQVMPQPQYAPQVQPQPQYNAGPAGVVLRIPWKDKPYADPFINQLKANRQVRWDGDRKVWVPQPGADLSGLERWISS
jgi:hypothetical protein